MAGSRHDADQKAGMRKWEENPLAVHAQAQQHPEGRETEREWVPWIVPVFVAANIAMFAVAMYANNCPAHAHAHALGAGKKCVGAGFLGRFAFQPLNQNPLLGPSSAALEKLGALVWDKVVHEREGWRLFTCIWLHAGVVHLLANMLSLVLVGLRLEQQFGFVRVGVIYLASGVGGSVLSSLFIRDNISVGASGALFGLLGAMLSELFTNWTIYTNKVRGGAGDSPAGDRDQPGDRHAPARGQLRPHRGVPHGVPPRVRAPHAPALRLVAALRAAVLRQGRRPQVPHLPVGPARRGFGDSRHRAGGRDDDALQRCEWERTLPVVPLSQLRADRQMELWEIRHLLFFYHPTSILMQR